MDELNTITEKNLETLLKNLLEAIRDGEPAHVDECDISTYEENGLLTSDKGLVLNFSDGLEVRLTIRAYKNGYRLG